MSGSMLLDCLRDQSLSELVMIVVSIFLTEVID